MPVILMQHYAPRDRVYEDAEYALYHYPKQYFSRIEPYTPFIYYRPKGKAQLRPDSYHYFGYGVLGESYPDHTRSDHRFVNLIEARPFPRPVPLRDPAGRYYETGETTASGQYQSAVRRIGETAYFRILAAADAVPAGVSPLVQAGRWNQLEYADMQATQAPKDELRRIQAIPAGAGYVPRSETPVNVFEAAALQERARADHQRVLSVIAREVHSIGGNCWYNNNIDLFANCAGDRLLIEAKSLNDPLDAVHRMRYGMGQLMDYGVRYRAEVTGATPVLAFGRPPDRQTSWISTILNENNIAFVSAEDDRLLPLNDKAQGLALFRG